MPFRTTRGVYIDIREVEFRDGEPVEKETGKTLHRSSGKMGKRYKNGLPPEEVGEEFGVDTLRLYEMYMGAARNECAVEHGRHSRDGSVSYSACGATLSMRLQY